MPLPTHRLDLAAVPADPQALPLDAARSLLADLVERGIIDAEGWPGPAANAAVEGGFARIRIDLPERAALYANRVGGFRVTCPDDGRNLVPLFGRAMTAWRQGGSRSLQCGCGREHALETLSFAPPAAFGRLAVVVADAAGYRPTPTLDDLTQARLGPIHWIATRV